MTTPLAATSLPQAFDDDAWDDDFTPEQALAWAESPEP